MINYGAKTCVFTHAYAHVRTHEEIKIDFSNFRDTIRFGKEEQNHNIWQKLGVLD